MVELLLEMHRLLCIVNLLYVICDTGYGLRELHQLRCFFFPFQSSGRSWRPGEDPTIQLWQCVNKTLRTQAWNKAHVKTGGWSWKKKHLTALIPFHSQRETQSHVDDMKESERHEKLRHDTNKDVFETLLPIKKTKFIPINFPPKSLMKCKSYRIWLISKGDRSLLAGTVGDLLAALFSSTQLLLSNDSFI